MVTVDSAAVARQGSIRRSPARARIVTAAAGLFAEHGVGGTSLQMIADTIGVTKAAVYHQFKTKSEIVVAAVEEELARLTAVMDAAEAEASAECVREALLVRIVDLAIERRRMESALVGDPVMVRYFAYHQPFRQVVDRLYRMLTGGCGPEAQMRAAMLTAAIGGAVMHPLAVDLGSDTVRAQLLDLARGFLDQSGDRSG
ncbi:TetR/AcrR family transcriptional regulator [Streptomyces sp. NPDC020802]|uniref:TetR/AcrR family transcriptional regulator n=1 Tax=Streptomyces sp. NPDC020802 TaxID=3365094 RepID=UPI0037875667